MAWRSPKSQSFPISLFHALCLVSLIHSSHSAPLSSYLVSSFSSPNPRLPFRLMAVYNTTGDVYIGAEEEIYHLGSDFNLRETVELKTSPVMGRLCLDTTDPSLESYTQIQLECTDQTGSNYNVIQATHIGPAGSQLADSLSINSTDDVMYAVFSKENSSPVQSALCLYKMSDIQEKFTQAVVGCITCQSDCDGRSIDYLQGNECGAESIQCPAILLLNPSTTEPWAHTICTYPLFGSRAFAVAATQVPNDQNPQSRECQATEGCNAYYTYANGVNPLAASPVLTFSDVEPTSIITTTERAYTVAFIGSSEGDLLKVHILNSSSAYQYENVPLGQGSVLRDVFLDEDKEQIILATGSDEGSQVLKLSLANCSNYHTCDECIGGNDGDGGDPYCGWCTLETRCTRYMDCARSDESTRWLSYNAVQCVSISDIQPSDSIRHDLSEQPLAITVQQLPALTNSFEYRCVFDSYEVSAVTSGNTVDCTTPPSSSVPQIPKGADNVGVALSIKSTESGVNFVERDFFFFDCTRLSSCSSCVTSRWPCDWCVYENRCTHDSSSCVDDIIVNGINMPSQTGRRGQEYCPQILGVPEETLIPVNIAAGYSIMASNLPTDPTKVTMYECVMHVDGSEQTVEVTDFNETFVNCPDRQYMFSSDVLQTNVSVSVRWNSQNIIDDLTGSEVTLYKCSLNSDSCSRCLSPVSTPPRLKCLWCGGDCNVQESEVCHGNTPLNQDQYLQCNPPEITGFYPAIAPVDGGTRLEVFGTDLGVNFEDISSIRVAGIECDLNDMEEFYEPGQSVSCLTGRAGQIVEGQIDLIVTLDSQVREASSEDEFLYRDPMISGFTPTEGPAAGGTRVTISGDFLTSGRNVIARFGDAECIDIARSLNETSCTTTESSEDSYALTMTFDGTQLTTTDVFTFMPNPVITGLDRTQSIISGGLDITVTGERFDLIQMPVIKAVSQTSEAETSAICNGNGSATVLTCPSPPHPGDTASRRRRQSEEGLTASLQFDFDGLVIVAGDITYFPDPIYYKFDGPDSIVNLPENNLLELRGSNLDLASNEGDLQVFVGGDGICVVRNLKSEKLICEMPDSAPTRGFRNGSLGEGVTRNLPAVHVVHGNLEFLPGFVKTNSELNILPIVISVMVVAILVMLFVFVVVGRRLTKKRREANQVREELELGRRRLRSRLREVPDTKLELTDVDDRVKKYGIPFRDHNQYVTVMLFGGLGVRPETSDPEYMEDFMEQSLMSFYRSLKNEDTVVDVIKALDVKNQNKPPTKPDTIVNKLVTNWIALCMYGYIKRHVLYPMFMLYQAMKTQCEKGPVDVTTDEAYFTLDYNRLFDQDISFQEVTLFVVDEDDNAFLNVKVLDTDSVGQAKQKILDSIWNAVWLKDAGTYLILRDEDEGTGGHVSGRVNTLKTYGLDHGSRVALRPKVAMPDSSGYQQLNVHAIAEDKYESITPTETETTPGPSTQKKSNHGAMHLKTKMADISPSDPIKQRSAGLGKKLAIPHMLTTKKGN
ncbi:plexin-A4-like [Diadema antillarum]|uniref:plexin-A4-like n=1 Tax=Diadema antillarum TaxID=105358 RepID=UPI003A8A3778